jgi:hypothetical protein
MLRFVRIPLAALTVVVLTLSLDARQAHVHPMFEVPLQPLAQQARRLETALRFLGQPLPAADHEAINGALAMPDERAAVARLQAILDPYVLAQVHINPESRVRVEQGAASPELVQGGTRLFLVKVINEAGVTAPLTVQSPNIGRVCVSAWTSGGSPEPEQRLTLADVRDRWAERSIYT